MLKQKQMKNPKGEMLLRVGNGLPSFFVSNVKCQVSLRNFGILLLE